MSWAADAAGHPDPRALKDAGCLFVGQYVGTDYQHFGVSRGYIDACLALDLGVLLIFEEWASQFLGGYPVARQMMARMRAGWDALGAPNDGTVLPAIAVVDPSPGAVPGHEAELRDFVHGIEDALWLPAWTGYGSRYGLELATGVAPRMTRRWGVGTWGYGERPDGSLPPDVPADMIQHGNRAAPVGGVDYNTLFRDDMGQWGGTLVPAPPSRPKENDLYIVRNRDTGQRLLYTALGVTPNIDESFSNELQFAGVPYYDLPGGVADSLGLVHIAHRRGIVQEVDDAISDEPGGGGGAPDLPAVPRDAWAAETNRRLDADLLDVQPGDGPAVHVA